MTTQNSRGQGFTMRDPQARQADTAPSPNPSTTVQDSPPTSAAAAELDPQIAQEMVDLQNLFDDALVGLVHGYNTALADYQERAEQVRQFFRGRVADVLTNKSLMRAIAQDAALLVQQNPTGLVTRKELPRFKRLSFEPYNPTISRPGSKVGNTLG